MKFPNGGRIDWVVRSLSQTDGIRREPAFFRNGAAPLALILIVVGTILRVRQYLFNRSLWLDEAYLSSNIVTRSYRALLEPLDDDQGAPIGFLLIEKLATAAFGNSEYALRLVPLLAGIAALPLFYLAARRLVGRTAALTGLGLLVFSRPGIYYSTEVKQYSVDLAVTVLILLLASWYLDREEHRAEGSRIPVLATLAVAGACAVWLSHPALFVLAGMGGTLLVWPRAGQRPRFRLADPALATVVAVWVASFAANYYFFLRSLDNNQFLRDYWQSAFPPLNAGLVFWLPRQFLAAFETPAGFALPDVAALICLLGCLHLIRTSPRTLCLLISPLAVCFAASLVRKYPFGDRLLIFGLPLVLMVMGAGVFGRFWAARERLAPAVMLTALFLPVAGSAVLGIFRPVTREELRPVLDAVSAEVAPGDVLYVYWAARPAFHFYTTVVGRHVFRDATIVYGTRNRARNHVLDRDGNWLRYQAEVERFRGLRRVWLIVAHSYGGAGVHEDKMLLFFLDGMGRQLSRKSAPGASAYLYDLSTPTTASR
jgi:hypothetical protein